MLAITSRDAACWCETGMPCTVVSDYCQNLRCVVRAGASVASYFLQPKASISLGASGAVFGLFAVSVLVKLSFNLKKLIECGILGQFVIKQLLQVSLLLDMQLCCGLHLT